jgi:hypothetical protein
MKSEKKSIRMAKKKQHELTPVNLLNLQPKLWDRDKFIERKKNNEALFSPDLMLKVKLRGKN